MGHTPYGYRIEDGRAVIDEEQAESVRKLYRGYLSGLGLMPATKQAGIETWHGSAKWLLQNRHYLGDAYYPAIIDRETFDKAEQGMGTKGRRKSHLFGGFFHKADGSLIKVSKGKESIPVTV